MIEIDGGYGEAGGQLIRTSVALAALTGKNLRLFNVRAKRGTSGLRPQHMNAVKAVAKLCDAKTTGVEVGSKEFTFEPGKINSKSLEVDIGTAGSIAMVYQALLPAAIFSKKEFTFSVIGGTNVPLSPSAEYFQHIFCYYLQEMGADIWVDKVKHGYFPKGGGKIKVRVKPSEIKPINLLERGELLKVDVYSTAAKGLKNANVADRQLEAFKKEFVEVKYGTLESKYEDTLSFGSNIHSHLHYENCKLGADILGERGVSSEKVGSACAGELLKEKNSNSTVDIHMADQLIPYIAHVGGTIKAREISEHTKTNIWVTEQFLPVKFEIKDNVISCKV